MNEYKLLRLAERCRSHLSQTDLAAIAAGEQLIRFDADAGFVLSPAADCPPLMRIYPLDGNTEVPDTVAGLLPLRAGWVSLAMPLLLRAHADRAMALSAPPASGVTSLWMVKTFMAHGQPQDAWDTIADMTDVEKTNAIHPNIRLIDGKTLKARDVDAISAEVPFIAPDDANWQAVMQAIASSRAQDLDTLLQAHPHLVSARALANSNPFSNPMTIAGMTANVETMAVLKTHGADLDFPDRDMKTALIHAARRGEIDLVQYLVAQGASRAWADYDGKTAEDYVNQYADDYERGALKSERNQVYVTMRGWFDSLPVTATPATEAEARVRLR